MIEKTCANSLRVLFIEQVFPEARYIYIVRDGRDVVASAAKRWTAPVEPGYLLKKLPYVPVTDIPVYAKRFIFNRLYQWRRVDKRQAIWGPQFEGMDAAVRNSSLDHVCALQWVACVEASERAFATISHDRVFRVRYESFVARPAAHLNEIFAWLGTPLTDETSLETVVQKISPRAVGNWRKSGLDDDALAVINPLLVRLGYEQESQN